MILKHIACLVMAGMLVSGAVAAQERSAAGAMESQVSWSALSSQIKAVDDKTKAVNSRVDQIIACNKKIRLYAPGANGADGEGCIEMPFPKEVEYVESNGWESHTFTLSCTKGRLISYAMANWTTKSNQLACGRSGANCDGNLTPSFKGQSSMTINVASYASAYIECK